MEQIDPALKVGQKIKRLIKCSKWKTQYNFALASGIELRTLSNYLNKGIDSITTIKYIASIFEVDWKELCD